jgi:hypothetical protein
MTPLIMMVVVEVEEVVEVVVLMISPDAALSTAAALGEDAFKESLILSVALLSAAVAFTSEHPFDDFPEPKSGNS